jgi:hypothetical protein
MKATKVLCIRLSVPEKRYACALSLKTNDCKRSKIGSVAHGLKWALRQQAKQEGLEQVVYTSSCD